MVSVVIAALSGTASIGTAGLMDALNKADLAQARWTRQPPRRVFDVHLAGLDGGTVTCRDGVSLHPSMTAADVRTPDVVVVPGLDDDLAASFDENRRDNGDVITSGGATAFLNLVLYLVERFAGHDRANLAAKVLLVDGDRPSQLPYIAFGRERSHDDVLVHQIQQHIDLHVDEPLRISQLAARFGLSERTLNRRFAAATGRGPRAYLQHARIQHAVRLLETVSDAIDQIRCRAGYSDPAAFRRVFKRATGLSPSRYREIYGLRNGPGT